MREKVYLTENFSLEEFVRSTTAINMGLDNTPPDSILNVLEQTAHKMEIIRTYLQGRSIHILSAYRNPQLNTAVGGSHNSQHMRGEAVDFVCPSFGTPREVCGFLMPLVKVIGIDQLIFERTWVHVSFSHQPRHQVLTLVKAGKYLKGLV